MATNGILAHVRGPDVSAGHAHLPRPGPEQSTTPRRAVVLDVAELGLVRITYELHWYRHRKNHFWHWIAVHAERAESTDPRPEPPCPF